MRILQAAAIATLLLLGLTSCATDRDFHCPSWPMFLSDNNSPYYLHCTLPEGGDFD